MSKAWRPDENSTPLSGREARGWARLQREWREETRERRLPHGSRTALVLLAALCVAAGLGLYAMAGPVDVFEREAGSDWSAVDKAAGR
ncbi:MAG TPA: hypothetical protein VFO51_03255 [Sphingomicrobium sp.]|nr:hypothetical protein [Sphingomicrobium sp.]